MRLFSRVLFTGLMGASCAEVPPTPAVQHQADMQATRTWIRGPLMGTCLELSGPESQWACAIVFKGAFAKLRGDQFTRADHFRIELAKAKATDEMRRLGARTEQESWLRGPKTRACLEAPLATYAEGCLKSVQADIEALNRLDNMKDDPPVVRAERAVARIEALEHERTIDRQRGQQNDPAQQQAVDPSLVLGVGGGLFGTSTATLPPQ